jgi:hypothetical protein
MASWTEMMGTGESGCAGGCGVCGLQQQFPDRTGRLQSGVVCGCEPGDACPGAPLPPGDGTDGVQDAYLCY